MNEIWKNIRSAESDYIMHPNGVDMLKYKFVRDPVSALKIIREDFIDPDSDESLASMAFGEFDELLQDINHAGVEIENEDLALFVEKGMENDESLGVLFSFFRDAGYTKWASVIGPSIFGSTLTIFGCFMVI